MQTQSSTTVRDVFLHLLSIIALYLVSFAFGRLIFSYINIYFPDALAYGGDEYESLRFSLASLIVVFPVYFFVTRFLARERAKPEYHEVRLRRWLIYLTLFLAAIVIITDLVTLLHILLGGELTVRFILKVFTVLLIAAAVFYYYLWELQSRMPVIRIFIAGVVMVVTAFVVFGFFVIGSPTHRRAVRFDERRVSDLRDVQYQIVNYWQQKEKLPITLDDLNDPIRGFIAPRDPETNFSYEYHQQTPLAFELCAAFKTEAQASAHPKLPTPVFEGPYPHAEGYNENWQHGVGITCFTRTIDPELYPPTKLKR